MNKKEIQLAIRRMKKALDAAFNVMMVVDTTSIASASGAYATALKVEIAYYERRLARET